MDHKKRLENLQGRLHEADIGFLVVTSWQNLLYLTGITHISGESRWPNQMALVVPAQGDVAFIPTQGFSKSVAAERKDIKIVLPYAEDLGIFPYKSKWRRVAEVVSDSGMRGEGVAAELATLTTPNYLELQKELQGRPLHAGDHILREMRAVKEPEELDCIRRAARLTDTIMNEVVTRYLVPGLTERQLANRLRETALRYETEAGFVQIFSGARGYFQNITASDKRIEEHEIVLVDWGVRFNNYATDITRAYCLGEPNAKQRETCHIVSEILDSAIGMMRPGIITGKIDDHVKEEFGKRGLANLWIHRLGHGMGIDVAEWPNLAGVDTTPLQANMVFAVEPGIYYPEFGIRLEDNVIVHEHGCEVLTRTPREVTVV